MVLICKTFSNWPVGSGGEDENVKSLLTDRQATGDQKSSLELLAQASYKLLYYGKSELVIVVSSISS